ncbi:hypothetical protein N9850_01010 [Granulosicoccus sp.]|nr:hypothetical protein [Granulosicoccus sp.]MDB4222324.1 hypothetical protein [Granulosicoccus sp.]
MGENKMLYRLYTMVLLCVLLVSCDQSNTDLAEPSSQPAPPLSDPANEPAADPIVAPVAEPVIEPIAEPIVVPVAEPVIEPIAEPIVAPVAEPVIEPIAEPVVVPVAEPVIEPVAEPVVVPVAEPVIEPVAEPVAEPVVVPLDDAEVEPVVEENYNGCTASTMSEISQCLSSNKPHIDITRDITCTALPCTITISNTNSVTLDGNGFTVKRLIGQKASPLLRIVNSTNIQVVNVTLDDDKNGVKCPLLCQKMVDVTSSTDVTFGEVHVLNAASYAMWIYNTNGFIFDKSSIRNSHVLGMFIGHYKIPNDRKNISRRLYISNSVFTENATNAIAVHGAGGDELNIITGNYFSENHIFGRFLDSNGKFYGGGQVYISEADNLEFSDNSVVTGHCSNCRNPTHGVHGIELGRPDDPSVTLNNVRVIGNYVVDNDACGILGNPSANINTTVVVSDNDVLKNGCGIVYLDSATVNNNTTD